MDVSRIGPFQGFSAVRRDFDVKSCLRETLADDVRNRTLIFDQENFHGLANLSMPGSNEKHMKG